MKIKIFLLYIIIIICNTKLFSKQSNISENVIAENRINIINIIQESSSIELLTNAGRIFGILSVFLLGIIIFIGLSARLFNSIFGLSNVLRFHKKFAILSLLILLFHPILLIIANLIEDVSVIEFFSSYISFYPFTLGIVALFIFILVVTTSLLFKFMNYFIWINIHRLTIVAFIFSCIHLYNFGILSGLNPEIPILNVFISFGIFFSLFGLIARIIIDFKYKTKKTSIIKLNKETYNTTSIIMNKPAGFKFKPGQFCFISFYKKGMKKQHPFTISSSPDQDIICFTIKSKGKFSSMINTLKSGDKVKIDGPYGNFIIKDNNKLVFIAGGVGITPFKSILTSQNKIVLIDEIILIYANKNKNEIIFNNFFTNLKNNKIKIINILSQEKKNGYEHGHITLEILKKHVDFKENFYICGPPTMQRNILKILKKNTVKRKNIFIEKFFM